MPANGDVNKIVDNIESTLIGIKNAYAKLDGFLRIVDEIFDADHNPQVNTLEKQKRDNQQINIFLDLLDLILFLIDRATAQLREAEIKERVEELDVAGLKLELSKKEINQRLNEELLSQKKKINELKNEIKEILKIFQNLMDAHRALKNSILFCLYSIIGSSDRVIKIPDVSVEINFNDLIHSLRNGLPTVIDNNSFKANNLDEEMFKLISEYIKDLHNHLDDISKNKIIQHTFDVIKKDLANSQLYSNFEKIQKEANKLELHLESAVSQFKHKLEDVSLEAKEGFLMTLKNFQRDDVKINVAPPILDASNFAAKINQNPISSAKRSEEHKSIPNESIADRLAKRANRVIEDSAPELERPKGPRR